MPRDRSDIVYDWRKEMQQALPRLPTDYRSEIEVVCNRMLDAYINPTRFIDSLEGIAAKANGGYAVIMQYVLPKVERSTLGTKPSGELVLRLHQALVDAKTADAVLTGMTADESARLQPFFINPVPYDTFKRKLMDILHERKYGHERQAASSYKTAATKVRTSTSWSSLKRCARQQSE